MGDVCWLCCIKDRWRGLGSACGGFRGRLWGGREGGECIHLLRRLPFLWCIEIEFGSDIWKVWK